jgi:hypothetical protein
LRAENCQDAPAKIAVRKQRIEFQRFHWDPSNDQPALRLVINRDEQTEKKFA